MSVMNEVNCYETPRKSLAQAHASHQFSFLYYIYTIYMYLQIYKY